MKSLTISKKRAIIAAALCFGVMIILCVRVGWVQIVKGTEYAKLAVAQQTKDIPVEAKRGMIYDTNGRELAVSATCYSVWARPASVRGEDPKKQDAAVAHTSAVLAEILGEDAEAVQKMLNQKKPLVKIAKYLEKDTADKIRAEKLPGIEIAEDIRRYYPLGSFAAHTLGSVTDDNEGLSGLELQYNEYLSGTAGRWIRDTDRAGNGLSYGNEEYYQAEDGLALQLTMDEVIQHYVEKTIKSVQKETKSDRVMCLMMSPKTGDILALAQTPDFDPNDSKTPLKKSEQEKLKKMSDSEKLEYWNKMWRNSLISDVYEPGSTFKLLTTAMALEEAKVKPKETFTCGGSVNVAGSTIRCWSYDNPHGHQTLEEAVGNSCNPVFIKLAQRMGIDKFYNYLETFGVTTKTGVDFPGEGSSILQGKDTAGPVGLATMGFGQGVAVTPIQLLTAVSSFGNEGKMMQPRFVKALLDENGRTVQEFEPKVVRQTVSQQTAKEICDIMEYVVESGGAGATKVERYRVGGKTGTAQKSRPDGKGYYQNKTDSSFIGMAPMEDPQVAILLIVDNPKGVKFGSVTAAPGAKKILEDTLRYMELKKKES